MMLRVAKSTDRVVRVVHFGDPDDCIFHFYLSVDDLNYIGGAMFEIQHAPSTYQTHTRNSQCNVLTFPLFGLISEYTHI